MLIKLPKRFFQDHKERDLDTPTIVKENNRNVWVNANDPHLAELKSDADYYSLMWDMGSFDKWVFGIARSAKATVKAIDNGTGA
jgi:hypothetical protein|tara:strand:+ start:553 stop:804 length:252 start_codon:yes stop_codon:yes gene_type:complete